MLRRFAWVGLAVLMVLALSAGPALAGDGCKASCDKACGDKTPCQHRLHCSAPGGQHFNVVKDCKKCCEGCDGCKGCCGDCPEAVCGQDHKCGETHKKGEHHHQCHALGCLFHGVFGHHHCGCHHGCGHHHGCQCHRGACAKKADEKCEHKCCEAYCQHCHGWFQCAHRHFTSSEQTVR